MPRLPIISDREALLAFKKDGWEHMRTKGDHLIMAKPGVRANLSIPDHQELDRGTLRKLIALAGLSVDEFMELLE